MSGQLADRAALVTGGGRGIGAAVAMALSDAGARVMVTARHGNEIDEVAAGIRRRGGHAFAAVCDVTRESDVARLGERARADLGAVDILVQCAGAGASAPLQRITLDDWNRMLAVNATSAFLCIREFLPDMVARGWGRIVNLASRAGLEGARYVAHYSAAKHALMGLTRSAAMEVEGKGVTVNALCPGYVDTPMTEETIANVQARTGKSREQAMAAVLQTTGQSRMLSTGEIAAAVVTLCLPEADNTNGAAILLPREGRAT